MEFSKGFKELSELVDQLAGYGLDVPNRDEAIEYLRAVGYHRSGGYRYVFRRLLPESDQDVTSRTFREDAYIDGASLKDVIALTDFDRKLREVCLKGCLEFESRIKYEIAHVLARRSVFALDESEESLDEAAFEGSPSKFEKLEETVRKAISDAAHEDAVAHHLVKYGEPLPIWIVIQILSFGSLPYLFQIMKEDDQKEVAAAFGVKQSRKFSAWLRTIADLRNVSAHNSRLFNRRMKRAVSVPESSIDAELLGHLSDDGLYTSPEPSHRAYRGMALLAYFLRSHGHGHEWSRSLITVLRKLPEVNVAMDGGTTKLSLQRNVGFPEGWQEMSLWQTS